MKLALVIVSLALIAAGLVQIRQAENVVRHDMIQLQRRYHLDARRRLWDQQVRMAYLLAPREVEKRALAAGLVAPGREADFARRPDEDSGR